MRPDEDSELAPESSDTSDQKSEYSESEYNVDDKKQDLPPCGQFGLEKWCPGEGCAMCEAALKGLSQSDVPFVDVGTVKRGDDQKLAFEKASVATLKTPPPKKPSFFALAEVCLVYSGVLFPMRFVSDVFRFLLLPLDSLAPSGALYIGRFQVAETPAKVKKQKKARRVH